ncbi:MAG: peptidoglycan editing factor PgeF [Myxococcota bacterium]
MTIPVFQSSSLLHELGVEHGFGTCRSEDAPVPGLVTAKQVHGKTLARVPSRDPELEADALWSDEPGVAVGIVTADCVPLLLVSMECRTVAAVHAGWRGSAARIGRSVVTELARVSGTDPSSFVGVLGPHIGPCCYEVDQPVRRLIPDASVFSPSRRPGHYMLDLFELNRLQLVQAGLREDGIERVGGCTACETGLYHSYRRDGRSHRMVHWIRVPES